MAAKKISNKARIAKLELKRRELNRLYSRSMKMAAKYSAEITKVGNLINKILTRNSIL